MSVFGCLLLIWIVGAFPAVGFAIGILVLLWGAITGAIK